MQAGAAQYQMVQLLLKYRSHGLKCGWDSPFKLWSWQKGPIYPGAWIWHMTQELPLQGTGVLPLWMCG